MLPDPEQAPEDGVSMVVALMAQVAILSGNEGIKNLPGLWTYEFGDGWVIRTNGHAYGEMFDTVEIPPYHTLIHHHGFPVLLTSPFEGIAIGENSEVTVIDALTAELRRLKRLPPREGSDDIDALLQS